MLYLVNTTILPVAPTGEGWGTWRVAPLDTQGVLSFLTAEQWCSAIGHVSTAEIISELLGMEVPMNRLNVVPDRGDALIAFKLKSRPPEGQILTREQIQEIGFSWFKLTYDGI